MDARGSDVDLRRTVEVWLADPRALSDDARRKACHDLLDDEERARAARFRFDRHRHQFIAAHALVRCALGRATSRSPEDLRFDVGSHGRPELLEASGLSFNASHTDGLVAVGLTRAGTLGLDVEPLDRGRDSTAIAEHYFAPDEVAQLTALPTARRPRRFIEFWTLKESYIKAWGLGLSIPLRDFWFDLRGQGPPRIAFAPERDDHPHRWSFHLRALASDHALAVALWHPDGTAPAPPALELRWVDLPSSIARSISGSVIRVETVAWNEP